MKRTLPFLAAAASVAAILAGTAHAGPSPATSCYPQSPGERLCLATGTVGSSARSTAVTPVCHFGKNVDPIFYLMNGCKPPAAKAKKKP